MTGKLIDNKCRARCVGMDCKRRRRMMAKLRGGTAELRIEIGRQHGLRREDRVCKECGSGEVEDTALCDEMCVCSEGKEETGELDE